MVGWEVWTPAFAFRHRKDVSFVASLPSGGLATDDDVLPQGIAREGLAVELVAQLHDIGHLDEEALDELDGLVLGDAAGGLVGDIVGVHVLVKAVQGLAVAVVLDVHDDVHEPDELDGLMEGAGGLQRNVRADLGDLKQLSLALLVLLGLESSRARSL